MADTDDLMDEFLRRRGHGEAGTWEVDHNKKACPECGAIHECDAGRCDVCGWEPTRE